jgi:glycosyltransferase involved in cell wall biosynthesis
VIPNGIDLAATAALAAQPCPPFPQGHLHIVTAARLSPEKRIDRLLQAFALVVPHYPVDLTIIGDGPTAPQLRTLAAQLGIAERIHWQGHQGNVFPFLRAATCFVHCCEFEGFGYAMLEALACGTPVIAEDCPYGPREVLGGGAYGYLVPPGDIPAMAAAMKTLMEQDESARLELVAQGRKRAEYFSLKRMVASYEALFTTMAAGFPSQKTFASPP